MQRLVPPLSATGRRAGQLALAWAVGVTLQASAFGQPSDAAGSRYGAPVAAVDELPAADVGEPLLMYRRDDAENESTASVPPSDAGQATNPLRTSAEAPQFPPIATPSPRQTDAAPPIATDHSPAPAPSEPPASAPPIPTFDPLSPLATPPIVRHDASLLQASHETELASMPLEDAAQTRPENNGNSEARRLAPRSPGAPTSLANHDATRQGPTLPFAFSKFDSLSTAGAGLAAVVALFIACMWLLRRASGGKPSGVLPSEAFAVLGRAPLTAQSFAHLLRVGNKLVLVAVTADGIQPLTEVTEPIEVDRLTGICASGRGPAAEFQQVLAQLAREPARGFLGGEAAAASGRRRA